MSSLILSAYDLLRSLKSPEEARHASRVICTPCNLPDTETDPRESRPPRPSVRPPVVRWRFFGPFAFATIRPSDVQGPGPKAQGTAPRERRTLDLRICHLCSVHTARNTGEDGERPRPRPRFQSFIYRTHACANGIYGDGDLRGGRTDSRFPNPGSESRRHIAIGCNCRYWPCPVSSVQCPTCDVQCAVQYARKSECLPGKGGSARCDVWSTYPDS